MSAVLDEATKLQAEAQKNLEEADRLKRLTEAYPDLRRHVGRWNKVVYCSASVNSQVTKYETRYNCGCCNDSPLELWAYLETPLGRVHSDPPCFIIGEKEPFTRMSVSRAGWKESLRAAGLPETIIVQAGARFSEEREKAREFVENAFEERGDPPDPLL